jgi:hypothetical protein
MVHVPASLSMRGKLERRTFDNSTDAEKFAAKLRTQYHKGIRGGVVDAATAHNATAAEKLLQDAGLNITVIEAVRTYIEARVILDLHNATIPEVIKTWTAARTARGDDRTFGEAAAAFIVEKEMEWSKRYALNIGQTMEALPDWFMEMKIPDITEPIMLKATRESVKTPTAIDTRMRHIRSLCSGKGRKKRKARALALLTIGQCAAMLRACQTPEERRVVALLLFAGIRPDKTHGEISKLDWSAVKAGKINISVEVSKTDTDRIIPIRPRLARLIKGHPTEGKVLPVGWDKRYPAIRKAAGMTSDPKWQDATRHAFASHHLVGYGETSTQAAIGHTEGSRTLFKHYRAAVPEEAGKKFFGDHGKPATKKGRKA